MISKWHWLLLQFTRMLWLRASLLAVLAVLTALGAVLIERYIPGRMPVDIGADAVGGILNIIASSMLAVTTFSLGVMMQAYGAASANVTPRATKLLMQDSTTQNVLAIFVGAFLFSLVGIVTLSADAYGERGRVVLYVVTLIVIGLVVVTILRWIDHLSHFGRVSETIARVEAAARDAMEARAGAPHMGGAPAIPVLDTARAIRASAIGYVQHVDIGALQGCAEKGEGRVHVAVLPGAFVHNGAVLARVEGEISEGDVREAFTINNERTFEQDPRFGLCVLAEVAQRALSPAVNDPGTAIAVIGHLVRVLAIWAERTPEEKAACSRVHAPALSDEDLLDDAFGAVARDAAAMTEVHLRLQKALAALALMGDGAFQGAVKRQSEVALTRARATLTLEADKARVAAAAASVGMRSR